MERDERLECTRLTSFIDKPAAAGITTLIQIIATIRMDFEDPP
jgi:hypothetical protein